jgi:hypothetical protein
MSSRNKPLVKLIRQGISGGYRNATYRTPRSPRFQAPSIGKTVKKKREDGIFSQVGQLAEGSMKKTECAHRDVEA